MVTLETMKAVLCDRRGEQIPLVQRSGSARVLEVNEGGVVLLVGGRRTALTWARVRSAAERLAANHELSVVELGGAAGCRRPGCRGGRHAGWPRDGLPGARCAARQGRAGNAGPPADRAARGSEWQRASSRPVARIVLRHEGSGAEFSGCLEAKEPTAAVHERAAWAARGSEAESVC